MPSEQGRANPPRPGLIFIARKRSILGVVEKVLTDRANHSPLAEPPNNHSPLEGIVEKVPFFGDRGDAPLDLKTTPPYPPLSGGQEKAKPPLPGGGALPFYTPLTRGGRGGCSLDNGFFNRPLRGSEIHRAPLVRFSNSPSRARLTSSAGFVAPLRRERTQSTPSFRIHLPRNAIKNKSRPAITPAYTEGAFSGYRVPYFKVRTGRAYFMLCSTLPQRPFRNHLSCPMTAPDSHKMRF